MYQYDWASLWAMQWLYGTYFQHLFQMFPNSLIHTGVEYVDNGVSSVSIMLCLNRDVKPKSILLIANTPAYSVMSSQASFYLF